MFYKTFCGDIFCLKSAVLFVIKLLLTKVRHLKNIQNTSEEK